MEVFFNSGTWIIATFMFGKTQGFQCNTTLENEYVAQIGTAVGVHFKS